MTKKRRHELCDQCDKGYRFDGHQDETPVRKTCADWNAVCPVGTPVIYHEVMGDGKPVHTRTRSVAWFLGYSAVCLIEGKSGGCAISHMLVVIGDPVTPCCGYDWRKMHSTIGSGKDGLLHRKGCPVASNE